MSAPVGTAAGTVNLLDRSVFTHTAQPEIDAVSQLAGSLATAILPVPVGTDPNLALYHNAARLLQLSEAQVARHHRR